MYGCESWTVKKAECRRIDAFELWCWRRLLRVPWIARRSTLSSQWKDWCWSRSSNTLACLEDLTHWKRPWCWERLKAGEGGDRGWDDWTASPTQWIWVWANSGRWFGMLQSMGSQGVRHDWVTEQHQQPARTDHFAFGWGNGGAGEKPLNSSNSQPWKGWVIGTMTR